jgi:hypothetical protein
MGRVDATRELDPWSPQSDGDLGGPQTERPAASDPPVIARAQGCHAQPGLAPAGAAHLHRALEVDQRIAAVADQEPETSLPRVSAPL